MSIETCVVFGKPKGQVGEGGALFLPKQVFVHISEAAPLRLASSLVNNHLDDELQHLW